MIRNLTLALDIFEARGCVGKYGGQQMLGGHALNLRRDFLAILKAQQSQGPVCIPAPARGEDRRIQRRLFKNWLHSCRLQEIENICQRKAVLLGQSDIRTVVGGRRLQLKVESNAETLAKRQAPGVVDAPAKRRMDDQLDAAAFVKKAFGNHSGLRWNSAQNGAALQNVFDRLLSAGIIEPAFFLEPSYGCRYIWLRRREADRRSMRQHLADLLPQLSNMLGKFLRPRWRFTSPERHTGGSTMRILHQHAAGVSLDAANHPRSISQQ